MKSLLTSLLITIVLVILIGVIGTSLGMLLAHLVDTGQEIIFAALLLVLGITCLLPAIHRARSDTERNTDSTVQ